MKKYIFSFLIIVVIAIPLYVLAGGLNGPLVPCGRSGQEPCTLCDIFIMVQNIIDFIFAAIFILAPIYVLWGGFEILTSAGEAGKISNGKKKITAAVVGIIIALLAWTGLNMVFNTLVSKGDGFPWPWNEVKCEVKPPAVGGGMCHLQYKDGPDAMIATYDIEADCKKDCSERCDLVIPRENCEAWCCLNVNKGGQDNVCIPTTGQWCQRSAPSGSDSWKLSGINSKQKGDASYALTSFINCMYGKISGLIITSISEDALCSNPSCDTTKTKCGAHVINSCHYGGAACTGSSYAVDFSTGTQCSDIKIAALSCNSNAWVNWEGNHTHISVDNSSCGCAEKGAGNSCP